MFGVAPRLFDLLLDFAFDCAETGRVDGVTRPGDLVGVGAGDPSEGEGDFDDDGRDGDFCDDFSVGDAGTGDCPVFVDSWITFSSGFTYSRICRSNSSNFASSKLR